MATVDAVATAATGLLAAGGGTVIAQLVQAWRRRGQDRAAEDSVIVGAAHDVVTLLRAELREQEERHREEMGRLRVQLQTAQDEVAQLKRDLAAAGGAA